MAVAQTVQQIRLACTAAAKQAEQQMKAMAQEVAEAAKLLAVLAQVMLQEQALRVLMVPLVLVVKVMLQTMVMRVLEAVVGTEVPAHIPIVALMTTVVAAAALVM